jgi:hypothetical protein
VGFQDKDDGSGYDYHYDLNGNLTRDDLSVALLLNLKKNIDQTINLNFYA